MLLWLAIQLFKEYKLCRPHYVCHCLNIRGTKVEVEIEI